MATVAKTTELEGIPAALRRTNGQAKPSYEELLAKIAQLEAQAARKSALVLKVSEKGLSVSTEWDGFPSRSLASNG
jgi:hypothetical protein